MLFSDSIMKTDDSIIFMNTFSASECMRLLDAVLGNAIKDLSRITDIPEDILIQDYINKHDFNPIREVLKKTHPGENFDLPTLVDIWIEKHDDYE